MSLLVASIVALSAYSAIGLKQPAGGQAFMINHPLQLIFSADNGTFSGTHEQKYVLERTVVTKDFSPFVPLCQSALLGTIFPNGLNDTSKSVDAVLVTTGIGSVTAALCVQQTIQYVSTNGIWDQTSKAFASLDPSSPFTATYFMGTSGWSPFVGGLNPNSTNGDCGVKRNSQRVSIGSVCVSPISYDFECGIHPEQPVQQGQNGECFDLGYYNTFFREDLFGKCAYSSVPAGGHKLAQSVQQSTRTLPAMDAGLASLVGHFWSSMQLGNENKKNLIAPTNPLITTQCAEAVSHAIWVGAQEDYQCRLLTGKLLSEGLPNAHGKLRKDNSKHKNMDEDQYVCTSAMEGYGFLSAATRIIPTVPAVIIRGASNYDMYPLYQKAGVSGSGLLWQQNNHYLSTDDEKLFNVGGYHYAIITTNQVILNYLANLN